MDDINRLIELVKCGNSCISIVTHEEYEALEVVRQAAETLEYGMQIWSVERGVRNGFFPVLPTADEQQQKTPATGLMSLLQSPPKTICVALDLAPFLSEQVTLRVLRDTIHILTANGNILVLIDSQDTLPDVVRSYTRQFELTLPGENQLDNLVRTTLRGIHDKTPLQVGITKHGMTAIVRNLRGLSLRQARQIIYDSVAIEKKFSDQDVNKIIAGKRRMIRADGLLEYVEAPLDMDEIGGMENLKRWLLLRENAFTEQAAKFGITPPRGVMILGVQGAGKSLCAKAIATAWHQPLYRLDPGVLFNSYVGQSEKNLRQALKQIEAMAPAILWIDEIEKGFASAASQSTDGGLSKRMFGTLLTWMQEHRPPVFMVATANDIEALPPELLRKGRFDEIFFVNLPDLSARKDIFGIHLLKHKRDPKNFDLDLLAKESEGYNGAEIEQAVISALHEGFSKQTDVTTDMIAAAIKNSPPLSITMREKIEELCTWAQGRCVPAD
jgi:SpoVK/Ycf46/Vps4 family AAA+-type ATPase